MTAHRRTASDVKLEINQAIEKIKLNKYKTLYNTQCTTHYTLQYKTLYITKHFILYNHNTLKYTTLYTTINIELYTIL